MTEDLTSMYTALVSLRISRFQACRGLSSSEMWRIQKIGPSFSDISIDFHTTVLVPIFHASP